MKIKLLIILHNMRSGGAQRFILHLLNRIDRTKFSLTLLTIQNKGELQSEIPADVEVHSLNTKLKYSFFKLVRYIKNEKPQVIFSTSELVNLMISLMVAIFRKTKFIARESNIWSYHVPFKHMRFVFKLIIKFFYRKLDLIICQSTDMFEDFASNFGISRDKLLLIHNPVDVEEVEKRYQNTQSPFTSESVNYLAMGRFEDQKGFDLLVNAFSLVKNRNVKLYIIGVDYDGGEYQEYIKSLIKKNGLERRIEILGYQANPFKYLYHADCFVLSSRYEGFPNVVLEANACGTPVLAFNCPGGVDEIIEEGENGWLVENGNVIQLAEKWDQSVNALDLINRSEIIEIINTKFNIGKIIAQYEDAILDNC